MLEKRDFVRCHERTHDWMHEEEGSNAFYSAARTLATRCKLLDDMKMRSRHIGAKHTLHL